jgi:hypothetical protein
MGVQYIRTNRFLPTGISHPAVLLRPTTSAAQTNQALDASNPRSSPAEGTE